MIETDVPGSTVAVDGISTFLRDSLKVQVGNAGDDVLGAKKYAESHWLGESGESYTDYAKKIVSLHDEHEERIGRAARKIDGYSARLARMQRRMSEIRSDARAGGLTVTGTTIATPPDVVGPSLPANATPEQVQAYNDATTAYQAAADKIKLYNRLVEETDLAWTSFTDWIDTNLTPVAESLDAPLVEKLLTYLKENAGMLGIGWSLTHGERALGKQVDKIKAELKYQRTSRRSGNPARRAAAKGAEEIRGLKNKMKWFGKGGKLLGPLGGAIEIWNGLESDSPAGGVLAAGAGIAAGAAVVAFAPVTVPTVVVVGGVVLAGAAAGAVATWAWDALPDDWTEPVDDWVGDRWDDTKDAVSDGWDAVKSWF